MSYDISDEMELDMTRAANAQLNADRLRLIQERNHLRTCFEMLRNPRSLQHVKEIVDIALKDQEYASIKGSGQFGSSSGTSGI